MEFVRVSMGARELFPIPLLYYLWCYAVVQSASGTVVRVVQSWDTCTEKQIILKQRIAVNYFNTPPELTWVSAKTR